MALTAWRGAIRAGKHDEMFLSALPPWLSLTRGQAAFRKTNEMFKSGCHTGSLYRAIKISLSQCSHLNYFSDQANVSGQNGTFSEHLLGLGGQMSSNTFPSKENSAGLVFSLLSDYKTP